jgi:hypothetical protein
MQPLLTSEWSLVLDGKKYLRVAESAPLAGNTLRSFTL